MSGQDFIYEEKSGERKNGERDYITNVVIETCWSEVIHLAPQYIVILAP